MTQTAIVLKPDKNPDPAANGYDHPAFGQAPIVFDGKDVDQLVGFLSYVETLEKNAGTVAEQEAVYLAPFFEAYSQRLSDALPGSRPLDRRSWYQKAYKRTPAHESTLPDLIKPGALSAIFQKVSTHHKNTILTELTIIPQSWVKDGDNPGNILKDMPVFSIDFKYSGSTQSFGFLQVITRNDAGSAQASTAIPFFAVDDKSLQAIADYAPEKLLGHLQFALSRSNHDMLHSYTCEGVNNRIVRGYNKGVTKDMSRWFDNFDSFFRNGKYSIGYEDWATVSLRKSWAYMKDGIWGKQLRQAVEDYYDELSRIASEQQNAGVSQYDAHHCYDTYGSMMVFTLMRLMPQDDPLILRCIDRMKQEDPLPGALVLDEIAHGSKRRLSAIADRCNNSYESQLVDSLCRLYQETKTPPLNTLRQVCRKKTESFKDILEGGHRKLREVLLKELTAETEESKNNKQLLSAMISDTQEFLSSGSYQPEPLLNAISPPLHEAVFSILEKDNPKKPSSRLAPLFKAYSDKNFPLYADSGTPSYECVKQFQFIRGLRQVAQLHDLPDYDARISTCLDMTDRVDLEMIEAAAKSTGFSPS